MMIASFPQVGTIMTHRHSRVTMGSEQEKCKNAGKLQEADRQSPAAATAAGLI